MRFVQVYDMPDKNGWDAHAQLNENHTTLARSVDGPVAALLEDLQQRGLLDETAVLCISEHGRTPKVQQVSGGGRDFMRPVTGPLYGVPPERVVGSSVGLVYRDGHLYTTDQPEFLDDGPIKPVRLWSRIGRRPILAGGNSNGDIEMLEFTRGLRLLVLHDDADREFDYTAGAEKSLDQASKDGWTVVSMKNDWATVFSDQ